MASPSERSPLLTKEPKSTSVNESPVSFTGGKGRSCLYRFRRSRSLVVGVVFGAFMLDLMIITSIDPLLPDILTKFDYFKVSANQTMLEIDSYNKSTEHTGMSKYIGLVVATKPGIEIISNLIVGYIVDRIGHKGPMVVGCLFNTVATIGFAYAPYFWLLLVARACQAIASSLSVVSGLALIACRFQDDGARSKALSTAFGGLSVGIVIGYPFGSATYQFVNRAAPFLILAGISLIDGILRLMIVTPDRPLSEENDEEGNADKESGNVKNMCKMLMDPYILMALAINFAPNFGLGVFLATGPAYMLDQLQAEQWAIGTVLAIAMVWQIASQTLAGFFGLKYGRWKFCLVGMWLYAIGISLYPFCTSIWYVIIPEIFVRSGFGIIICVVSPLLSYLADKRHGKFYGGVYGLYTASYNLGLTLGPIAGGSLLKPLTFRFLYWGVAIFVFIVSFLSFAFRNPTGSNTQLSPKKRDDDIAHMDNERAKDIAKNCEFSSQSDQDDTVAYEGDFDTESTHESLRNDSVNIMDESLKNSSLKMLDESSKSSSVEVDTTGSFRSTTLPHSEEISSAGADSTESIKSNSTSNSKSSSDRTKASASGEEDMSGSIQTESMKSCESELDDTNPSENLDSTNYSENLDDTNYSENLDDTNYSENLEDTNYSENLDDTDSLTNGLYDTLSASTCSTGSSE